MSDYDALVKVYRADLDQVSDEMSSRYALRPLIEDIRVEPQRVHSWLVAVFLDEPTHARPEYRVTRRLAAAHRLLVSAKASIEMLSLPLDSPIHAQVDAALDQFYAYVEVTCTEDGFFRAGHSIEYHSAVELAARIAALVRLAQQRETVLRHIDRDSLARTAAALSADLAAARDILSVDALDRALAAASTPAEIAQTPAAARA